MTQPPLLLPKQGGGSRKVAGPSARDSGPPKSAMVSSPRVEVRRGSRRTRTVTAYQERDTIVVLIPQRMSKADEQTFVRDMVEKVLARAGAVVRTAGRWRSSPSGSRACDDLLGADSRPGARADRCFVGDEPAAALGFLHTEYGPHRAVPSPATHASVGR